MLFLRRFCLTGLGWGKFLILIFLCLKANAQNDVMLQTFYWDVPVDGQNKKGLWWVHLTRKAEDFRSLGITGLWLPAPSKGNWGIYDMGYGVYDHYDLGNYDQRGSVETRFGSRSELENLVHVMQDTAGGRSYIEVYADIILNHMYASAENAEPNPIVKQYVFDEAIRHGVQRMPYPTNEIRWVIPHARAGEYLIDVKGYHLDFETSYLQRGYEIEIGFGDTQNLSGWFWADSISEGSAVVVRHPGLPIRSFIHSPDHFDRYRIVAPGQEDLVIRLSARHLEDGQWRWAEQTRGYYPFRIFYEGIDIAPDLLEAHTYTHYFYPERTCHTEPRYTWHYMHFNPADDDSWLEGWSENGAMMPFTKAFGNDLNTLDTQVQQRLNDWGRWLVEQIGFDGFRLDFVWGYQEEVAASWIRNLPLKNQQQRFIVAEYWGPAPAIHSWVKRVEAQGARAAAFDFLLKETLTAMCNGDDRFDMRQLNHAGMIRNNTGYALPPQSVVTFLENHDTGKEHDKWVTRDWHLGHAYILTHPGRPCLFYPHLYGVTLEDMADRSIQQPVPATVGDDIRKLVNVRNTYLGGMLSVLSDHETALPQENLAHVYIARRQGNQQKQGAVVVLNNSFETRGLHVQVNTDGFDHWTGQKLVDLINPGAEAWVDENGEVFLSAPGRGYAIFVREEDKSPH